MRLHSNPTFHCTVATISDLDSLAVADQPCRELVSALAPGRVEEGTSSDQTTPCSTVMAMVTEREREVRGEEKGRKIGGEGGRSDETIYFLVN